MKLIKKSNRNFIWITVLVFPLACIVLFLGLQKISMLEIDEKLLLLENRITKQLKENKTVSSLAPLIVISEIKNITKEKKVWGIAKIYDKEEGEKDNFRELKSYKKINGISYEIKLREDLIEGEDFLFLIAAVFFSILLLVIFLLYYFNKKLSQKIWKPFYKNLKILKEFSLQKESVSSFEDSDIDEFKELKTALEELTKKAKTDYVTLKEFTENASHEIQTPLAIISLNLEDILQGEHTESDYKKLNSSMQSIKRLSKINEKLLLLAKIENQQFSSSKSIDLTQIIKDKIEELELLIESKNLEIRQNYNDDFVIKLDPFLANTLIINLLSNAIKFTPDNGLIEIICVSDCIEINNPCEDNIDIKNLFERFTKNTSKNVPVNNSRQNSVGLGLAIVKKITDVNNLKINAVVENKTFKIFIKK